MLHRSADKMRLGEPKYLGLEFHARRIDTFCTVYPNLRSDCE